MPKQSIYFLNSAYWEFDWPKDMAPPIGQMDAFIRAKYERKQYAKKGDIPDPNSLLKVICLLFLI
jgi:hypothetical protein